MMVYCYWIYSWYITDYTEGILVNNIVINVLVYSWYITDYTEGILFNNIVIVCYFTYGILLLIILMVYLLILLLIILRESCLIILWSHATLFKVFYYQLYCGYIITGYTEGILFNNICDHMLLYPLYIVTDCTDGVLLLIILRESCLIRLWSCATSLMVYCYWLC